MEKRRRSVFLQRDMLISMIEYSIEKHSQGGKTVLVMIYQMIELIEEYLELLSAGVKGKRKPSDNMQPDALKSRLEEYKQKQVLGETSVMVAIPHMTELITLYLELLDRKKK